jgi:hypothetical protein
MKINNQEIILLPKDKYIYTHQRLNNAYLGLNKSTLLSEMTFYFDGSHYIASIDIKRNYIVIGMIETDGLFHLIEELKFTHHIYPKGILIVQDQIILGGCFGDSGKYKTNAIIYSYSIKNHKYTKIESVELNNTGNFQLFVNTLKTNSEFSYISKGEYFELVKMGSNNGNIPELILRKTLNLPNIIDNIKDAWQDEKYLVVLTYKINDKNWNKSINIFSNNDYNKVIRFSQNHRNYEDSDNESIKLYSYGGMWFTPYLEEDLRYNWLSVVTIEYYNILLISSFENGIGIYSIEEQNLNSVRNEPLSKIIYYNPWKLNVVSVKLLNNKKEIIVIFEDFTNDIKLYSNVIISIEELLIFYYKKTFRQLPENIINNESSQDLNYDKNSDYCNSCHESPCMCSDREKTSTVYEF